MHWKKITAVAVIALFMISCKSAQKGKEDTSGGKETAIKEYWDDKSLKGVGPVKGKEKNGKWTLYHKTSGEKLGEGEFLNNKQQGKWTFFYKNGKVSTEGEFIEDQKTGEWTGYYDSGERMWKAALQ